MSKGTKGNALVARVQMLAWAVANSDDTRPSLRHIYCDGENLVATNGKILVFTENAEKLPVGFYDYCTTGSGRSKEGKFVPVTDEKAKDWHYPPWRNVVPKWTGGAGEKEIEFRGDSTGIEAEIFKLQFSLASYEAESLIAQEYIDLIVKTGLTYKVRMTDGRLPILLSAGECFSMVIMPRWSHPSEVNNLMLAYRADVIVAWKEKHKHDALAAAALAGEEPVAEAVPVAEEAESAGTASPEPVAEKVVEAEVEPITEPVAEAPKRAAKKKPQKPRKSAYAYVCELADGTRVTLASIAEVKARGDVVKCRIEAAAAKKKPRKAA